MKLTLDTDFAVAENKSALRTVAFFAERRNRAAFDAFDRILDREGGEAPVKADEVG